MGAIAKGGDRQIAGLLDAGDALLFAAGLHLMETPCFSPESITSMLAADVQVATFTTGQGNSYGAVLAPTVKITANPATAAALTEQIDFNASALIAGIGTQAELMPALARLSSFYQLDQRIAGVIPSSQRFAGAGHGGQISG